MFVLCFGIHEDMRHLKGHPEQIQGVFSKSCILLEGMVKEQFLYLKQAKQIHLLINCIKFIIYFIKRKTRGWLRSFLPLDEHSNVL